MREIYPTVSVTQLCRLFGISRQAWYANQERENTKQNNSAFILELVLLLRDSMPRLGTHKLYFKIKQELSKQHIKIGRDSLHSLLRDNNLLVRNRRKFKPITTQSGFGLPVFPDLLKNALILKPELFWVSDITYINVGTGFNYLSLITDAYSRRIMGYCLYENLSTAGCLIALEMAINQRLFLQTQLTHHSDRGFQYRSSKYLKLLGENGIWSSMTQNGSPYENAIAERINGILKKEFLLGGVFTNHQTAADAVRQSIEAYNSLRPHASCDYLTPKEAHLKTGELTKRWKSVNKTTPVSP
jgi:putative transposase